MSYELGYNLDEAVKRQNISVKDISQLRYEISDFSVPKTLTNKQLALFLDSCGSVDVAKKVIKTYYKVRQDVPEHFTNRDPMLPEIQQCLDNQNYFLLPTIPSTGVNIIYHRLSNSKASNYCFDNAIKTYFMTIDACLYKEGPHPGIIFLFDMQNVGLSHLTRIRLSSIKKFFHYLQDGLPAKLCQIHVLNVVSFFDKILSMIKPFMRAEIFKQLHTHNTNMDFNEFYEKWIPKECLPAEYGGDLASIDELNTNFRKNLENLREYFIAEENQRYPKDDNNNNESISEKIKDSGKQLSRLEID